MNFFDEEQVLPYLKNIRQTGFNKNLMNYNADMDADIREAVCPFCNKKGTSKFYAYQSIRKDLYMMYQGKPSHFRIKRMRLECTCKSQHNTFSAGYEVLNRQSFSKGYLEFIVRDWILHKDETFDSLAKKHSIKPGVISQYVDGLVELLSEYTTLSAPDWLICIRFPYDNNFRCCYMGYDESEKRISILGFSSSYTTHSLLDYLNQLKSKSRIDYVKIISVDLISKLPEKVQQLFDYKTVMIDCYDLCKQIKYLCGLDKESKGKKDEIIADVESTLLKDNNSLSLRSTVKPKISVWKQKGINVLTGIFKDMDTYFSFIERYLLFRRDHPHLISEMIGKEETLHTLFRENESQKVKASQMEYRLHSFYEDKRAQFAEFFIAQSPSRQDNSESAEYNEPFNVMVLRTFYDNGQYKNLYYQSPEKINALWEYYGYTSSAALLQFPEDAEYSLDFDDFLSYVPNKSAYSYILKKYKKK